MKGDTWTHKGILLLTVLWPVPGRAAVEYTILDLGTMGGTYSDARGINSSGQVVGFANSPSTGMDRAFRTVANGAINSATDDLGTLGGTFSIALCINDNGQVAGYSGTPSDYAYHAFRTSANLSINPATDDLGTLSSRPQYTYSQANRINSTGQVAGLSDTTNTPNYPAHGFRTTSSGAITSGSDLGSLGGTYSEALSINAGGVVVGYSDITGGTVSHAFRTLANSAIRPGLDDLGTLGGTGSYAADINSTGQCVGAAQVAGDTGWHAFRIAAGAIITVAADIGTLGGTNSKAAAINGSGQVVGVSDVAGGGQHAFVYDANGLRDLNSLVDPNSGWVLNIARDVNDLGEIVGTGTIAGQQHGFLLIPLSLGLPVVTTHPQTQGFCSPATGDATFAVLAAGPGVVSYLWKKGATSLIDNGHIVGCTTPTLTIHSFGATDTGTYRCMVSNGNGSVYSNAAGLTIDPPASITSQPQSTLICSATTAQFTVAASGATGYLWEFSTDGGATWNPAPGTNNQVAYTTAPVGSTDNGNNYRARVLNGGCAVFSTTAVLSVRLVKADFNQDCHVDSSDLTHLVACGTGPAMGPPAQGCQDADLDKDGDVDSDDFAIFQRCWTDTTILVDTSCQN